MSYGYKGITNDSVQRAFVTHPYAYWDGTFSDDEIDKISLQFSNIELEQSKTVDGATSSYRTSRNNFHHVNDENLWIFQRLNSLIEMVNDRFFNYDLNGYEFVQYAEYRAEDSGHYNYHIDMSMNGDNLRENRSGGLETRKLSLAMLLNEPGVDFDGGDFHVKLADTDEVVDCKKGRAIIFPSYLLHKVTPVTRGVRKSLVLWVTGPKFR